LALRAVAFTGSNVTLESRQTDPRVRKRLVWEIEQKLIDDDARPIVFYGRIATCWQPEVKGLTNMVNSIYNGSRFEDLCSTDSDRRRQTAMPARNRMWAEQQAAIRRARSLRAGLSL
jgi:hypothetical protein